MIKFSISTLALAVVVGAFGLVGTNPAEAQSKKTFISIGTGGPTGVYFVVGQSVCRMVHKAAAEGRKTGRKHGIRCSAPSTGGSNYNIGQIREGELDFGVAQSDWQYHAYNGSSKYKGKAYKKLRAVFSVHAEPYHIIVGKNSGIKSWADLKGKRFNIGNPGSGQRGTTEVLMKKYGTMKGDFKIATELTSTEQSKALCDGKIDAYGYTVGVPNAGVSVATDGCGAKIINLMTSVEKGLVDANPYYAFATIPKGTYKDDGCRRHHVWRDGDLRHQRRRARKSGLRSRSRGFREPQRLPQTAPGIQEPRSQANDQERLVGASAPRRHQVLQGKRLDVVLPARNLPAPHPDKQGGSPVF